MNDRTIPAAIIMLSMLPIAAAAAIAPVLGTLQQHFPEASSLSIRLILTLPQIMIIPSSIAAGYFSRRIPKKQLLITGLLLYTIGGLSGGLTGSLDMLLLCRALLGIGIGIIYPITTSLVSDFYHGERRTHMLGISTAVNNLGGVFATLISGFLASISWRMPFFIYLAAPFALICTMLWIPRVDAERERPASQPEYRWLTAPVVRSLAGILGLNVIFYTIPASTSMTISALALGSAVFCGLMLSIQNFCSFSAGTLFKHIYGYLSGSIRYLAVLLIISGFGLFLSVPRIPSLILSLILIGTGYGMLTPYYLLRISNSTRGHGRTAALSAASCCMFFGQFLNPLIISLLQRLVPGDAPSALFPTAVSLALTIPFILAMLLLDHRERISISDDL